MSVLRTEARRSIAPWLLVVFLAVGLGFFFLFSGPWIRDASAWDLQWVPSVLWTRYELSLLWPIVVCAAALQGMRDGRSGMDELLATTPLPVARRTAKVALVIGLAAVVAYLVIVAVGLGQVIANDGMFTFTWVLPLLAGIASVLAGASVGLALGRLMPHPLTAPAAGVVALVLSVFLQVAGDRGSAAEVLPNWLALLSPAAASPRSAFQDPVAAVSIGQLCWLLGLAATGFLVLAVRRWYAVLPALVGLAVALPLFPATAADNFTDNGKAALVCDGPVCVTTLHSDWLSTVAGPGRDALARLAKLPSAPKRVVETTEREFTRHGDPDPAVLTVRRDDYYVRSLSGRALEYQLLDTASGPTCGGWETESAARWVIAAWLIGDLTPVPHAEVFGATPTPLMRDAWTKLRAAPMAEQVRRVDAARLAGLSCHGDPYALLTGASS
ncbi:hypothetical protein VSH64_30765 [Amycolatopsis rhabdoformis]|uniref:ABC transporter permease n=1 Tax=Amycolatopsis rhabdoformis TaxID=1448059 RepID=A0ABZ1I0A4_9PSEU|nr:hypothetical protein [Amycolatopsis rhabdoformis]WSE27236.1 hypothetical protein VSH64_30765 [Amycolatopsis rhabdoformis]